MTDSTVQLCGEPSSSDDDEELISYLQTPKYSSTTVDEEHSDVINKHAQQKDSCETKGFESKSDCKEHTFTETNVNSTDTVVENSDQRPFNQQNINSEVVNLNLVSCAHNRNSDQDGVETNSNVLDKLEVTETSIVTNEQTEVKPFLKPDSTSTNLISETGKILLLSVNEISSEPSEVELMSQFWKTPESSSKEGGDCGGLQTYLSVEKELEVFLKQAEESGQSGKEKHFIITESNWSALCSKVSRMINFHQVHKSCVRKDVGTDTTDLDQNILCEKPDNKLLNHRSENSAIEGCTNNTGRFVRRNNKLVFERVPEPALAIEKYVSVVDGFTPDVEVSEHLYEYGSESEMNIDSILLTEDEQQVILNGNIDIKEAFDTTDCQVIAFAKKYDQLYDNKGTKQSQELCHSPEFTAQPVVFNIDDAGELQRVYCSSPKLLLNSNVSTNIKTQADIEEPVGSNLNQSLEISSNLESDEDFEFNRNRDSVENKNLIIKHHQITDMENKVKTETKQLDEVSSIQFLCENKELNQGQIKRKFGERTQPKDMKSDETKIKVLKTTPTHSINLRSRNSKAKLILKATNHRNLEQKSKSMTLSETESKPDDIEIKTADNSGDTKLESESPKVEFMQAIELDSQLSDPNGNCGEKMEGGISTADQKEKNPEDSEIDIESDLENYFSKVRSSKEAGKILVETQTDSDWSDRKNSPPVKKRANRETIFEHKSIIKKRRFTKNRKDLSDSGLEVVEEFREGATSMKQESLKKKTLKSKRGKILTTRSKMRNERMQNKTMQKSAEQNVEEKLGNHETLKKKRTWKIRFEKSVSFESGDDDENGSIAVSPIRKQKSLLTGLQKEVNQNAIVGIGKQRKSSKVQTNDSNHDLGKSQEGIMVTISNGITLQNVGNIEAKNKSAKASKDNCQRKKACEIETAKEDGRKKKTLPLSDSQSDEKRKTQSPKIMKLRKQRIRYEQNKWKELLTCEMMDIQRDVEQLDHDLKGPLNVRKVIKGILKTAKLKSKQNSKRDSEAKLFQKRKVSNELENPDGVDTENNGQNDTIKTEKTLTKWKKSSNSNSIETRSKVLTGAILERLHKRNKFSLGRKQVCGPKSKSEANTNLKTESQFENAHDSVLKSNPSNEMSVSTKPVKSVIDLAEEKAMFESNKTCFEIHESPPKIGVHGCFQQFVLNSPKRELDNPDLKLGSPILNVKHILPANTAVSPSKAADKLKDLLVKATSVRKIILN